MEFFEALWRDFTSVFSERVELGSNSVTTLNIIVWSLFIGFVLAIGATLYNKLVPGAIVRALIERGATSADTALGAKEVGCSNIFVRFALREGSSLRRIVNMVGDNEQSQATTDFYSAKYYVAEANIHRAKVIYGKPETSVFSVILSVIAFFLIAMVAFIAIPNIVQLVANVIGAIAPKSNII